MYQNVDNRNWYTYNETDYLTYTFPMETRVKKFTCTHSAGSGSSGTAEFQYKVELLDWEDNVLATKTVTSTVGATDEAIEFDGDGVVCAKVKWSRLSSKVSGATNIVYVRKAAIYGYSVATD